MLSFLEPRLEPFLSGAQSKHFASSCECERSAKVQRSSVSQGVAASFGSQGVAASSVAHKAPQNSGPQREVLVEPFERQEPVSAAQPRELSAI